MNWSQFLLYISGLYVVYYSLNIAFDVYKTRAMSGSSDDDDTLFFADDVIPKLVVPDDYDLDETEPSDSSISTPQQYPTAQMESTGAVPLKGIFDLAKAEVIEFTKDISYS